MNVSEYRLYISTNDIQYDNPYECSLLPDGETENKSNYDLYIAGYRIAFSEMTGYQWAKRNVLMCVVWGRLSINLLSGRYRTGILISEYYEKNYIDHYWFDFGAGLTGAGH